MEKESELVPEKRGIKELLKMMYKTLILGNITFFSVIIIVGILFSVAISLTSNEKLNYYEMIGMILLFYKIMIPVIILILSINFFYVLLKFFTKKDVASYVVMIGICMIGVAYIVYSFIDKKSFIDRANGAVNIKEISQMQQIDDCKNEGLVFYIVENENIVFRCGGELLFTYSEHRLPVQVLPLEIGK